MIKHIVMWKFKEGSDYGAFLEGLSALDGVIPEIKSMAVEKSAKKDSEYDAVLTAVFDSFEDLNTYKNDPRHLAVSAFCKQIRLSRASIDVEE